MADPSFAQCPGEGCPSFDPATDAPALAEALEEQLLYVREIGAVMSSDPNYIEDRILLDIPFESRSAIIAATGMTAVAETCRAVRSVDIREFALVGVSVGADSPLSQARAESLREAMLSRCVSEAIWIGSCPGPGCPAITVETETVRDSLPVTTGDDSTLIELRVLG